MNELYKDVFEARNSEDEQEVKLRSIWKDDSPVSVFHNGKMENNWKIKGVFAKEGSEPLRVRVANKDGTFQLLITAEEFLKWQGK
jgi:hypothetical protein